MKRLSSDAVKRFAGKAGADLVGIASADRFKQYPEEGRPEHMLHDAKSVIVVGVAYDLGRLFDDHGYNAVIIPHRIGNLDTDLRKSGDYMKIYPRLFGISTRHAAVEAGLGILGKSRLLITPRFGPRQRIAAVITDAKLNPDRKITNREAEELCLPSCQACIRACPGKALSTEGIAWEKCNEVIKPHNSMYGYSACCECMIACPAGRLP